MTKRFPARRESLNLAASPGVPGAFAPVCTGRGGPAGFDVGISPHGLSANLRQQEQETPEALSCHSPAKPLLTFSLTESQRDALSFAALCEAEDLAEGHEADELEVQEAIRNLCEAREVLNGGAL